MLNALERLQTFNEHGEPLLAHGKTVSKRNLASSQTTSHRHLHKASTQSLAPSDVSDTASMYVTFAGNETFTHC